MSETNEPPPASAGPAAKELANSLRDISDSLNVCGNDFSDILYPAARELERLDRLRLTDAEREAVGTAARIAGAVGESDVKATLRGLLERLK